jgi:hypothetical protein
MGNKSKVEKWSPATRYRIRAFSRALNSVLLGVPMASEPKASAIQKALGELPTQIFISDATLRNWILGRDLPNATSVQLIKNQFPQCVSWLQPDLHLSPMHRLLCAIDIWGARNIQSTTQLDSATRGITVTSGLRALVNQWGPSVDMHGDAVNVSELIIPRLKRKIPAEPFIDLYNSSNPLSLIDFMFASGAYLDLSEEELNDWAIDLASLTLISGAYFDQIPMRDLYFTGMTGSISGLLHSIFFKSHGTWPNAELIAWNLGSYDGVDDVASFSRRLFDAYEIANARIQEIGASLKAVGELN